MMRVAEVVKNDGKVAELVELTLVDLTSSCPGGAVARCSDCGRLGGRYLAVSSAQPEVPRGVRHTPRLNVVPELTGYFRWSQTCIRYRGIDISNSQRFSKSMPLCKAG